MQKEEVKEGALVCIYVDGRPHINTVVEQFPIQRGPARGDRYALLEGMGDPFPIKDLKPFNKGYRNTDELLTSEEWHKQEFALYKIYEPSAWSRPGNYDYSWFIERISREEFVRRLNQSTTSVNIPIKR
jgi:hypothetical protein